MLDARAFGRISSNPVLNEHLHYAAPADINKPLYEAADDKVLDYRDDYNNRPSNSISFMPHVKRVSVWYNQHGSNVSCQ